MSLRAAVNAKCKDCTYDDHSPGTWREQVAQCSCVSCPLWPYRPAPRSGPFANPPRDPEGVTREWLKAPIGCAILPHPLGHSTEGATKTPPTKKARPLPRKRA